MTIDIRPAGLHDEDQLFGLVRTFPTPTPIETDPYRSMFRQKLADPSAFIAVAVNGSSLVGYVSAHRHLAFYAAGSTAWVDEILVRDSERRCGVGRMLMDVVETWAARTGCELVSLATAGAADFYSNLGYTTKAGYFKKYLSRVTACHDGGGNDGLHL
jgi:GNAT superfamily N-acetyltransferase